MKKTPELGNQLLTVKQVAQSLNTSEKTVRRLVEAGDLPYVKLGRLIRVRPDDLERFIAGRRFG